jgi:hypothetical protein
LSAGSPRSFLRAGTPSPAPPSRAIMEARGPRHRLFPILPARSLFLFSIIGAATRPVLPLPSAALALFETLAAFRVVWWGLRAMGLGRLGRNPFPSNYCDLSYPPPAIYGPGLGHFTRPALCHLAIGPLGFRASPRSRCAWKPAVPDCVHADYFKRHAPVGVALGTWPVWTARRSTYL